MLGLLPPLMNRGDVQEYQTWEDDSGGDNIKPGRMTVMVTSLVGCTSLLLVLAMQVDES